MSVPARPLTVLRRALLELGIVPSPRAPELRAALDGDGARVGLDGDLALAMLPTGLARITLPGDALGTLVARAARVDLLARLGASLAEGGALAVPLVFPEGVGPWGRALLDGPRRVLGAAILPEPGTRSRAGAPAVHVYYTPTDLRDEAWDAGLEERAHRGGTVTFARAAPGATRPPHPPLRADLAIVAALVRAESLRRKSPREALSVARARGHDALRRDERERRDLHARIGWLDGFVPPRPNCFRRVLAESLLDAGAAAEVVVLSLDVARTGHAHFPSDPQEPLRRYDVTFEV